MKLNELRDLYRPGAINAYNSLAGYEPHPVIIFQDFDYEVIVRCDNFIPELH